MIYDILQVLVGFIGGGAVGAIVMSKYITKQQKNNPPINEKMIRAMYMQMGRKPSEKQIKQTMNSMNQYK